MRKGTSLHQRSDCAIVATRHHIILSLTAMQCATTSTSTSEGNSCLLIWENSSSTERYTSCRNSLQSLSYFPLLGLGEPKDKGQQDEEEVMDVNPNNDNSETNPEHNRSLEEIYDVLLHPREYWNYTKVWILIRSLLKTPYCQPKSIVVKKNEVVILPRFNEPLKKFLMNRHAHTWSCRVATCWWFVCMNIYGELDIEPLWGNDKRKKCGRDYLREDTVTLPICVEVIAPLSLRDPRTVGQPNQHPQALPVWLITIGPTGHEPVKPKLSHWVILTICLGEVFELQLIILRYTLMHRTLTTLYWALCCQLVIFRSYVNHFLYIYSVILYKVFPWPSSYQ